MCRLTVFLPCSRLSLSLYYLFLLSPLLLFTDGAASLSIDDLFDMGAAKKHARPAPRVLYGSGK
jgi:hypothetical protein